MAVIAFFQSFEAYACYFAPFTQNLIDFRGFRKMSMWAFKNVMISSQVLLRYIFFKVQEISNLAQYERFLLLKGQFQSLSKLPHPQGMFDNF